MSNVKKSRQLRHLVLLFVILMALILRIHHINHESLFMDELHQVSFYGNSPDEIIHLAATQQQPPLDYWIGHYISKISESDFFVRLPAALFGVASVFLLIIIVERRTNLTWGILTGGAMAMMPFPVYYSQEARPYSIAIFFILFVLWTLDRYLSNKNLGINLLLMFVAVFGLLLSRTLSPFIFVICLLCLMSLAFVVASNRFVVINLPKTKLIYAIAAIVAALLIYMPILNAILKGGSRYATNPTHFGINALVKGVENFDLLPLWKAYIAQLEPLGFILIPLIVVVPYVVINDKNKKGDLFVWIVMLLLPSAAFLHLFVFQAKTSLPFRPPYPVYILPLSLILSAISVAKIFQKVKAKGSKGFRTLVSVSSVIIAVLLVFTLYDFKTLPKRSDWKGLASYLAATYDKNDLLIFDSLVPMGGWEPTFYGFPRYYRGDSPLIPASYIPYKINTLVGGHYNPVLICFYYRDYFLTRHSIYPVMPGVGVVPDFTNVLHDTKLVVKSFTGFLVISLQVPSGNSVKDVSSLLKYMLQDLKSINDEELDLQIALAAAEKKAGVVSWREYIANVKTENAGPRKSEIADKIELIERSR